MRLLAQDYGHVFAAVLLFALILAVAYGTGYGGLGVATFALSAVAAVAGLAALGGVRRANREQSEAIRELHVLVGDERPRVASSNGPKPDPRVLLLDQQGEGVLRCRIERLRPRTIDIEEVLAHERALALRTLPAVQARAGERRVSSIELHRRASEESRTEFRETVGTYASTLREALVQYDAFRRERALLVSGRFRFVNHGSGPARNVTVLARFPEPFEVVRDTPARPVIPMRPSFHRDRTRLSALMGGDPRADVAASIPSRPSTSRSDGNVAVRIYGDESPIVEVRLDRLPESGSIDTEGDACWTLRLPTPGTYRVLWELHADELQHPAHGAVELEVLDLLDDVPIHSIKELIEEEARGTLDDIPRPPSS
jgi:hypothetical protein